MTGTDMVLWAAGSTAGASTQYDSKAVTTARPPEDAENLYTTLTPVESADGLFIEFTSTRPLEPAASFTDSFVITVDAQNDMIWAYSNYDSA
jgi:hypothetical protein